MREKPFLDELICRITDAADKYSLLTVVLPSRRVIRELMLRFSTQYIDTPKWMPRFTTMEEFVFEISNLAKADSLELSLMLYSSYVSVMNKAHKKYRSYADFVEWGGMLIGDFHQLDAQLANISEVLKYVSEEKRISGLDFELDENSEIQNAYLSFYTMLYPIYEDFISKMSEKGIAYAGWAERKALEVLKNEIEINKSAFYIFAGFNAITFSEESIMRFLVENMQAEVYWDADSYYMDDENQEAGLFLRRYSKDIKLGKNLNEAMITSFLPCVEPKLKTGEIVEVPQETGQVEMAAYYLYKWYIEDSFTGRTAVVLNEEDLLTPLLNTLPEGLEYNLSMGVSLKSCIIHRCIDNLLKAKEESDLYAPTGERKISLNTIVLLWRGEVWQKSMGKNGNEVETLLRKVSETNKSLFNKAEWQNIGKEYGCADNKWWLFVESFLFEDKIDKDSSTSGDSAIIYLGCVKNIIEFCISAWGDRKVPEYEMEYVYQALDYVNKEKEIREEYWHIPIPFYTWRKQFINKLSSLSINYRGDHSAKIQITGMLETRMLDFDRVIMLSVNEGVLPSGKYEGSFLLDSVKKYCHIPTEEEKTSMQAYYFYRLLAFSKKNVWIYCSGNSMEKSRFLWQIEYERPLPIVESIKYPFPISRSNVSKDIKVSKEKWMMEVLYKKMAKGISPSFLNCYILCEMKFFYKYILQIEEEDKFDTEIDAAKKGTAVHKVLETFFRKRIKIQLTQDDVREYRNSYKELLKLAMKEEFGSISYEEGRNGIECKKMEQWLYYFGLRFEKELRGSLWDRVLDCECEIDCDFKHPILPQDLNIKIVGKIDRLDAIGSDKRVVDYKTGTVKPLDIKINSFDDLRKNEKDKALQILLYAYMYWVKNGRKQNEFPLSYIYSLSMLNQGYIALNGDWVQKPEEEKVQDLEDFIANIVNELCDKGRAFTQNLDSCIYCSYTDLCGIRKRNTKEY